MQTYAPKYDVFAGRYAWRIFRAQGRLFARIYNPSASHPLVDIIGLVHDWPANNLDIGTYLDNGDNKITFLLISSIDILKGQSHEIFLLILVLLEISWGRFDFLRIFTELLYF